MASARGAAEIAADMATQEKLGTTEGKAVLSAGQVLQKILPAAGGSFIESYEFALYSYLAPYITGNFFAGGRGGSLGTWAGFAVTFAFRPLGGACFGYLADTVGRKPAMQWTIALMLIATILQGCLPTFHCCGVGWGWFGVATLLVLRALQGLSAGGELSTAAVYISEVSPHASLGFNLSWISVSGAFGAWVVAAMVVFTIESSLSEEAMLLWGWRVPYLTSVVPGAALVLCRRQLEETADFEELVRAEVQRKAGAQLEDGSAKEVTTADAVAQLSPMRELLADHKVALVIGSLGTAGMGALWYVPPIYGVSFIREFNGLPANAATFSQMLCFLIPTLLAPAVGMLIDLWGVGKTYTLAVVAGCLVAPAPLFYWWTHVRPGGAVAVVFLGQCVLGLVMALSTATYLWVVELFPVRVRTTGVSVAYNIGIGIFGGLGPLISDAGNKVIAPRGPLSAPAAYTLTAGSVSLLALAASRFLAARGTLQLTHIRKSPY